MYTNPGVFGEPQCRFGKFSTTVNEVGQRRAYSSPVSWYWLALQNVMSCKGSSTEDIHSRDILGTNRGLMGQQAYLRNCFTNETRWRLVCIRHLVWCSVEKTFLRVPRDSADVACGPVNPSAAFSLRDNVVLQRSGFILVHRSVLVAAPQLKWIRTRRIITFLVCSTKEASGCKGNARPHGQGRQGSLLGVWTVGSRRHFPDKHLFDDPVPPQV